MSAGQRRTKPVHRRESDRELEAPRKHKMYDLHSDSEIKSLHKLGKRKLKKTDKVDRPLKKKDKIGASIIDNDAEDEEKISFSKSKEEEDESGENSSDNSNSHEEEEEYATIKRELSEMSFEDLQKLQERLGTKVYNQVVHGGQKMEQRKKVFKRENKNRPMEISSKKPVPFIRHVVEVKKKVQRDPRFDDLSGAYSESFFQRSYSFLDDVKEREKRKLQQSLKKETNPEKKEKMNYLLNRMNQQELSKKQQQKRDELEKTLKKKEKELVSEGKTPYFLKKTERKKLELAERFKELKKSGKVDSYLKKKRKKTAQKAKKHLPNKQFS
ncbi:hypothetical protein ScPMuIL_014661 [Solemya velum]